MPVIPFGPLTRARRRAIIDEFGSAQRKVDAFKPIRERHAELRVIISGWYEKSPADQLFIEEGALYTLQVGKATNERKIFSMPKLFKTLGHEIFLRLCTFPLKSVDAFVDDKDHKDFIEETRTGPRKIEAVAKPANSLEKAA